MKDFFVKTVFLSYGFLKFKKFQMFIAQTCGLTNLHRTKPLSILELELKLKLIMKELKFTEDFMIKMHEIISESYGIINIIFKC